MVDRFSPELALVDRDLAAVLRGSLPDPGDCLAPRRAKTAVAIPVARGPTVSVPPALERVDAPVGAATAALRPAPSVESASTEPQSVRPRRGWRRIRRSALVLLTLGIVALPFVAFRSPEYPRAQGLTPSGNAGEEALPPNLSTKLPGSSMGHPAGRRIEETEDARERVLGWRHVPKADLYNVVFVSGRQRIDRWVTGTSITLPIAAVRASRTGPRIVYRWYVYPIYRKQQGVRFGKLIAQGSLRLPKGSFAR